MHKWAIDSLHGEALHLAKLVDDLYQLALSDVGALSYSRRELDPLEVLEEVVDAQRQRFTQSRLALEMPQRHAPDLRVFADSVRLSQLFHNLLENSRRYTDPGGRLEISWEVEGQTLHIDFRDSAPGVPMADLEQLFDRFYRGEKSRSRAKGGAGLGLAICRNIVEGHEGRIVARPSPLGGVWVRASLPLSAENLV